MSNRKIINAAATGGIGYYPVGNPTDAYYDNVSLLLNGDVEVDSNFANVSLLLDGNTLTDKSNNKAAVTAYGNAAVTSVNKKFGTGSYYFDGTGDYLTFPVGVGYLPADFTIECWVNPNAVSFLAGIFTLGSTYAWYNNNSNAPMEGFTICLDSIVYGASVIDYYPTPIAVGVWTHVAVVRNGTNISVYFNGVSVKSITNSTVFGTQTNNTAALGLFDAGRYYLNGYIDDFRITKGVARYTANFTPPVKALPTHEILDSSVYRLPVTAVGNARIDTATKKFGTGAMYFDGSSDYLDAGNNTNLQLSGDFTIEFWVNPDSNAATYGGIVGKRSQSNFTDGVDWVIQLQADGTVGFGYSGAGAYWSMGSYTAGQWAHHAITRSGTSIQTFKNGTSVTTATSSYTWASTVSLLIGRNDPTHDFKGFIDDLRITKGIARTITPPTAALPTIPPTIPADPWWGNVSLLLDGNTTDAYDPYWQNVSLMLTGDDFIDWSNQHNAVTNNGTVTLDTTNKKYNSSSYNFSGSNYLSIPTSSNFSFGTGNFSIEFWVRFTTVGADQQVLSLYSNSSTARTIALYTAANGTLNYYLSNNGSSWDIASGVLIGNISTSTWYYVALVRNGNTFTPYLDAISGTPTTSALSINGATSPVYIGSSFIPSSYFSGQIADLRITKGIARTITVPTAALPSYKIQDRTQNNLTLTPYGNVQLSTDVMKNGTGSMFFDGSGDYVSSPYSSNLLLNGVDATIECWIYPTRSPGAANLGLIQTIFVQGLGWWSGGVQANIYWLISPTAIEIGQAGGTVYSVSYTLTTNQWLHLAVVKTASNSITIYANGVSLGTQTARTDFGTTTSYSNNIGLGYFGDSQVANYFQGYIDDFRITKGYARYTQNFTPPSQSFATQYISTGYDANYADVSLLLNGNGTNGSQVFTDLSGNTKAFTNNGVTVNTTVKKYGTGSLSFNGSSNYILVGTNDASFNFGSGDFTMETWFNVPTLPNTYTRIITNFDGVVADPYTHEGPQIEISNVNKLTCRFGFADGTFADLAGSTTITANIWNHVALVRQGTSVKMYLNGVADGSITVSQAQYWNSNIKTIIGAWYINGSYTRFFNGYLDDLRITKGIARYTTNFTPPTYQLPTDTTGTVIDPLRSSTSLLLRGNGTNGSTSFTDESPNGLTVTNNGSVTVNTTTKKYGTGSMAFSGSNYLTIANHASLIMGTGDFTIEYWYYPNSFGNVTHIRAGADSAATFRIFSQTGGNVGWYNNTIKISSSGSQLLTLSAWNHISFSRTGGILRLFVNGNLFATTSADTVNYTGAIDVVGAYGSANENINGYIDDLRITKGYARYTSSFTPPTYEDPIVTGTVYDYNYPQVSLLLNGDGTNGSTVFNDLSSSPKTITNNGSVTVNTTTKKFGTGSMAFSGSNRLTAPPSTAHNFGSGDFTVECWVNQASTPAVVYFICNTASSTDAGPFTLYFVAGKPGIAVSTSPPTWNINTTVSTAIPINVWTHVAWVRSSNKWSIYVNGVENIIAASTPLTMITTTDQLSIGAANSNQYYFSGYVDDLRITKGLARYTQNFTPPTAPLPTSYS